MKSRVITFCVLIICSELVASIPYPEELASLLRAYSTSGAPSNNDFSNPLELPSVASSHNYGDSVSLRDFSGTESYEQGNSDYNYNPLEISTFQSSQNQGSSSALNELYDRSRIQQRNNDYEKYTQQSQLSLSELTLQRELEKQQQASLQNRLANQFIQTGGRNKYISNRDISSEISPPQIRRVSDSYVDSLPIETLLQHNLQQAKRVETMPIRSQLIQKTLPVINNQPSSLLDKLRPTHLNTRKSASQGYENIQQAVDPTVFGKQQYLQVPQGTGRKSVIDDARIKEILDEVEMANKVANSGYRDIEVEGGNQKYLPGSLTEIFSQLNKEKRGPIPEILNGSASVTHPSETEPKKPGSLTDIFAHLNLNQTKPGPIPEILNGSVSTTQQSKTEPTNPKENDPKKKRYLIIHPNGTQEYVNAIDSFVTHHSNYVLYTPENVTQGMKSGHIPTNNPYVHHTEVSTNAISKATVASITKNINATKTVALDAKPIKTVSALAVTTNSVLPTKQKISPNETIINKFVLDGNLKKNTTVPKKVPVISTPSGSVSAAATAAATATASVLTAKSMGLGSNQTVKPKIIKPRNPLLTAQSIAKVQVTLPHPKNLPHGKVNVSKPIYVSEIIIFEIDPLTMKPKIISDTIEEISKPNTTKPTNTTNNLLSSSTSTTSTTPMPTTTTTDPTKATSSTTTLPTTTTSTTTTTKPTTPTSTTTQSTTSTSTTTQPTTTTSTTTQPTTTTSTTAPPSTTISTTKRPTTTTSSTTPSSTTTSTTTQPTITKSTTKPPSTTTSTTTRPTTTTSSTTPSSTTTSTTTQPTTTKSSTTPSSTTTSTTTQPTTTTSTTTPPSTTTSTTTRPTTTTSSTTPSSTTTSTTTQPTTTTSSTTKFSTTTSTTTQPTTTTSSKTPSTTTSSTTTSTTTQPTTTTTTTTTSKPDSSTRPHDITVYRIDDKESTVPIWFETDLNDGGEDLLDKLTEGDDTPGSVYVFQIPVRPIIDRDTKTTIYPNGTIVEETIEAVWDDHTDKPKLVRATTIVHPNDKRNLGNEKNNNSDKEYNKNANEEDIDEKGDIDSDKEDNSDKKGDNVDGNEDNDDKDNKSDTS